MAFDGRPVAIFGPNGAGKTNILEAISFLSPGRGLRRATPDEVARRPEALGWKLKAGLQSLHQSHEVETFAEPGASRSVIIDGKAAAQAALGRISRMLWLVPAMDRLWIEGAEGRRRFLDRMTLSFEPGHAEAVLTYEKAMRERNRLLRDEVRDAGWYGALEAQMAEAGGVILMNRGMRWRAYRGGTGRRGNGLSGGRTDHPRAGGGRCSAGRKCVWPMPSPLAATATWPPGGR